MTFKDIEEYRKNAIDWLNEVDQPATAQVVDEAFSALVCVEQFKWERDVAIQQLEELGIGFGEKIDGIYLSREEYEELLRYQSIYEDSDFEID